MFRDHLPRLSFARACALAALLLLAQALGLAHGVAHSPVAATAVAELAALQVPCEDHDHGHGHGHAPAWAGSHEAGDVECRLVDQLGHADAPAPAHAAWLKPVPAAARLAAPDGAPWSERPCASYSARAPPR